MTHLADSADPGARERATAFVIEEAGRVGLLTDVLPGGFPVKAGDGRSDRRVQRAFAALQAFSAAYR